jgi:hypothetical protein
MSTPGSEDLLLGYLNARVHGRLQAARLSGRVCVGVRKRGRTKWWIAELGQTTRTWFAEELPAEFDAAVALDAKTALWVLGAAKERGPMHLVTGDQELWRAFVETYLKHNDPISLRVRGGS